MLREAEYAGKRKNGGSQSMMPETKYPCDCGGDRGLEPVWRHRKTAFGRIQTA